MRRVSVKIRPLRDNETPLLADFNYQVVYVVDWQKPQSNFVKRPDFIKFISAYGVHKDDICFAADVDGSVIGAAWARNSTLQKQELPDLVISVYPGYRGNGIGTKLLRALISAMRKDGQPGLSICVNKENRILNLLEREGFSVADQNEKDYVMELRFAPPSHNSREVILKERELKEELIATARALHAKGLIQGTGGNFSHRCERGMIITPSGMPYDSLLPDDLPVMTLDGVVAEGERKPSIEKELHAEIYRKRRDVNAVVHTHSIYAVAAASLRAPLPVLTDNQALLFGGAIPCAEYAQMGTRALAQNAARALASGSVALLANHGAVCVGATLADAAAKAEMLEIFAKIYFLTARRGGGVPLSDKQVKDESKDMTRRYGQ